MQSKPIIVLGGWRVNDIYKLTIQELENMGFEVVDITFHHENPAFCYPDFSSRLNVFIKKNFLRDKKAKQKLADKLLSQHRQNLEKEIKDKINAYNFFDHALICGGQIYSNEILMLIKNKTKGKMVAYQSDALDRFPEIWRCMDIFDKVYAFDPEDNIKYADKIYPATNFYFNMSEVRSQKSEVRSQKSEVRSQKSEVRSQKSEVRIIMTSIF